jgi:hypothetical protein
VPALRGQRQCGSFTTGRCKGKNKSRRKMYKIEREELCARGKAEETGNGAILNFSGAVPLCTHNGHFFLMHNKMNIYFLIRHSKTYHAI